MKKGLKIFLTVISIAFLIMICLLIRNRYSFGVWNPFTLPNRIECYDRRYYKSTFSPKALDEGNKHLYQIGKSDNKTGKELYIEGEKGEYVPVIIYLKTKDGKYQTYALSGGP